MRKFKTCRMRTLPFRLLVLVASALLFTAAFTPRADAFVVSYFNFEDSNAVTLLVDPTPDFFAPNVIGGDEAATGNPGGGLESSTTILTFGGNTPFVSAGTTINRTLNDSDTADPGFAIAYNKIQSGNATISFTVNLEFFAGYSLSFATNNNGNGYANVTLSWVGAASGSLTQAIPPSSGETITFPLGGGTLPASLN